MIGIKIKTLLVSVIMAVVSAAFAPTASAQQTFTGTVGSVALDGSQFTVIAANGTSIVIVVEPADTSLVDGLLRAKANGWSVTGSFNLETDGGVSKNVLDGTVTVLMYVPPRDLDGATSELQVQQFGLNHWSEEHVVCLE